MLTAYAWLYNALVIVYVGHFTSLTYGMKLSATFYKSHEDLVIT